MPKEILMAKIYDKEKFLQNYAMNEVNAAVSNIICDGNSIKIDVSERHFDVVTATENLYSTKAFTKESIRTTFYQILSSEIRRAIAAEPLMSVANKSDEAQKSQIYIAELNYAMEFIQARFVVNCAIYKKTEMEVLKTSIATSYRNWFCYYVRGWTSTRAYESYLDKQRNFCFPIINYRGMPRLREAIDMCLKAQALSEKLIKHKAELRLLEERIAKGKLMARLKAQIAKSKKLSKVGKVSKAGMANQFHEANQFRE